MENEPTNLYPCVSVEEHKIDDVLHLGSKDGEEVCEEGMEAMWVEQDLRKSKSPVAPSSVQATRFLGFRGLSRNKVVTKVQLLESNGNVTHVPRQVTPKSQETEPRKVATQRGSEEQELSSLGFDGESPNALSMTSLNAIMDAPMDDEAAKEDAPLSPSSTEKKSLMSYLISGRTRSSPSDKSKSPSFDEGIARALSMSPSLKRRQETSPSTVVEPSSRIVVEEVQPELDEDVEIPLVDDAPTLNVDSKTLKMLEDVMSQGDAESVTSLSGIKRFCYVQKPKGKEKKKETPPPVTKSFSTEFVSAPKNVPPAILLQRSWESLLQRDAATELDAPAYIRNIMSHDQEDDTTISDKYSVQRPSWEDKYGADDDEDDDANDDKYAVKTVKNDGEGRLGEEAPQAISNEKVLSDQEQAELSHQEPKSTPEKKGVFGSFRKGKQGTKFAVAQRKPEKKSKPESDTEPNTQIKTENNLKTKTVQAKKIIDLSKIIPKTDGKRSVKDTSDMPKSNAKPSLEDTLEMVKSNSTPPVGDTSDMPKSRGFSLFGSKRSKETSDVKPLLDPKPAITSSSEDLRKEERTGPMLNEEPGPTVIMQHESPRDSPTLEDESNQSTQDISLNPLVTQPTEISEEEEENIDSMIARIRSQKQKTYSGVDPMPTVTVHDAAARRRADP